MKTAISSIIIIVFLYGCSASKKIKTGASSIGADTVTKAASDPMRTRARKLLYSQNEIPFTSFSAKVKVEYEENGSKQPDVNAFVRMKKGEAIWISVAATFLNIEAYRILITRDSVIVLNKMEKAIENYPFSVIRDRISVPVNFDDLERLIAGKVVLAGDSISNYLVTGNFLQIAVALPNIYNTIYFTLPDYLLAKQAVTVSQPGDRFTANMLFENYEKTGDGYFSTTRDISVPEKKQKLVLTFRQYEFNKELSLPFSRPEGYEIK